MEYLMFHRNVSTVAYNGQTKVWFYIWPFDFFTATLVLTFIHLEGDGEASAIQLGNWVQFSALLLHATKSYTGPLTYNLYKVDHLSYQLQH